MKTWTPSSKDITREWFVIDADGETLGRLATRVASVLRGKHKPTFAPHMDMGDHVIVINASKIAMDENKAGKKVYHRHSGYPGGLKVIPFARLKDRRPTAVIEQAIRGMLPKNKLGRAQITKLKVYAGDVHPHAGQNPQPFPSHV